MNTFFTALPLAAALALGTPAALFAQSETTTEEATDEVQTQSGTVDEIESQLSMGEDADKDPELGKPYTKETIGAWEMRCIKTEARHA